MSFICINPLPAATIFSASSSAAVRNPLPHPLPFSKCCWNLSFLFSGPTVKLRLSPLVRLTPLRGTYLAASAAISDASSAEVDMVRGKDGSWSAKGEEKVVVLWDLDNKPPRGPPYDAAMSLRRLAGLFGSVVDVSAYANRHAFIHLPRWVLEQRRDQRQLEILERKGLSVPAEPYVCGVCGRKCRTHFDLRKHFKQLHERERNKKFARMKSLKGKRKQQYREKYISGNIKYEDAARELINPKTGYGLARELRRAGVFVKMVDDKPQAADYALKRQMQHSMSSGIDWLFLVSDDSDFTDMVRRARESDLKTVVVGDWRTSLGRHADLWVPWNGVESGDVAEEVLRAGGWRNMKIEEHLCSMEPDLDGEVDGSDLDVIVDEVTLTYSSFDRRRISEFSDDEDSVRDRLDDDDFRLYGSTLPDDNFFWNSEDSDYDDKCFTA